jgi:peptide/nickel transport system permease protein
MAKNMDLTFSDTSGDTLSRRLARFRIRATLTAARLKNMWLIYRQSPLAIIGLILIGLFGVLAVLHPILMATVWPSGIYDPQVGFDGTVMHPDGLSSAHLLGTDALGRDVLSQLLAATTPTFVLGITAALATAVSGTLVGALAGYYRGRVDTVLSRVSDTFLLLPAPILMVIVGTRFRDLGPLQLGLIYGLFAGIGNTAIVMRSLAMKLRVLPFIEVSKISGGGSFYILLRHIIPHLLPMAALQTMVAVTGAVVADGFISFFGFTRGISNWGTMIYNALIYGQSLGIIEPLWNALLPPSMALSLFGLAFYLTSRGMHRVADPRLR